MTTTILGDGPLGRAIAAALDARGEPMLVAGRPRGGRHEPAAFVGADAVVDASCGDAVARNVEAALDAGITRFVLATTAWHPDADRVAASLRRAGAAAVVAPNLTLGAAIFLRLVGEAGSLAAAIGGFEPSV